MASEPVYTLAFSALGRGDVLRVGGKGANLGELIAAGFPVPPGFCVTTDAFRDFVDAVPGHTEAAAALDALDPGDLPTLRDAAAKMRARLEAAPLPEAVTRAVLAAWHEAHDDAEHAEWAVRSSATAEDLAGASFAGQQDTYLNVVGEAALLDAVRRCQASLFTDRAVLYRLQQGFSSAEVALSVVVQRMVQPDVSGILFTADPISGHRHLASIDASYGLGEALVSGLVTPDVFRVDRRSGTIVDRQLGPKAKAIRPLPGGGTETVETTAAEREAFCLTDAQVLALGELAGRVEAHYGEPQDLEWCLEGETLYLVQSRPITTLYPIPEPATDHDILRVWMSFNHFQVMTDPMSPMGMDIWRRFLPFRSDPAGPSPYTQPAGGRLYIDMTPVLGRDFSRKLFLRITRGVDPIFGATLAHVVARPGFVEGALQVKAPMPAFLAWAIPGMIRVWDTLLFRDPVKLRGRVEVILEGLHAEVLEGIAAAPAGAPRIAAARWGLGGILKKALLGALSRVLPAILAGVVVKRLAGPYVSPEDLAALDQGLEGNITTEMDLAVGDLADAARESDAVVEAIRGGERDLATLVALPGGEILGAAFDAFLARFGMRGPSEIDLARTRWHEDPASLVQVVAGHLSGEAGSHRAHHAAMKVRGEAAARRVVEATPGFFRRRVVRRLVRLNRTLFALREHPKFMLIRVIEAVRRLVLGLGEELVATGRLDDARDVFWFPLAELEAALEDPSIELRTRVAERREAQAHFERLKPPRLLTSDGEMPVVMPDGGDLPEGALAGSAVSSGTVEGIARVVLDPATETLHSGEILVAPFTDPGWTPLFVNAAGLVMEVGGLMTHGSVVAREYGIPAVVGVLEATTRIHAGDRIRVHGDLGYVEVLAPDAPPPADSEAHP